MRLIEQLELPLWEVLKEAAIAPDEADVRQLLDGLEAALQTLDTIGQLQVAAEAIAQIVQVFQDRSLLTFEELEATNSDEGPVMPEDAFDRYVRQTMELDLDQFIEPLASLPRKSPERQEIIDDPSSVVGELDRDALLHALDEQMSQHPGLTEAEVFNQTIAIAHDEDVGTWGNTIQSWLSEHAQNAILFLQLQQALEMPIAQMWLALLLNGFLLEQRGAFYDSNSIWVIGRDIQEP